MNDNDIKEMLGNLGYGEEPPKELMGIVTEFRRRKCAIYPMALDVSDVVTATIIYDMLMANAEKSKKAKG